MSQKELHRLELIQKIRDERLSVVQAAERLDLSRSQVNRLLQAYYRDGPAGMVEIWLYLCLAALGYCYPTNRYRLPSKPIPRAVGHGEAIGQCDSQQHRQQIEREFLRHGLSQN